MASPVSSARTSAIVWTFASVLVLAGVSSAAARLPIAPRRLLPAPAWFPGLVRPVGHVSWDASPREWVDEQGYSRAKASKEAARLRREGFVEEAGELVTAKYGYAASEAVVFRGSVAARREKMIKGREDRIVMGRGAKLFAVPGLPNAEGFSVVEGEGEQPITVPGASGLVVFEVGRCVFEVNVNPGATPPTDAAVQQALTTVATRLADAVAGVCS
jgi:hypothetical protein